MLKDDEIKAIGDQVIDGLRIVDYISKHPRKDLKHPAKNRAARMYQRRKYWAAKNVEPPPIHPEHPDAYKWDNVGLRFDEISDEELERRLNEYWEKVKI